MSYSFGGIVAFEMACQLERAGFEVELLAILDADASGLGQAQSNYKLNVVGMVRNLPFWIQDDLLKTPPAHTWSRIKKRVNRLLQSDDANGNGASWIAPNRGLDLAEMLEFQEIPDQYHEVWKASAFALQHYIPQAFAGKITLFRVRAQRLLGPFDPLRGWGRFATEGVDIRIVPGTHDKLLVEPYVRALAAKLKACLDE